MDVSTNDRRWPSANEKRWHHLFFDRKKVFRLWTFRTLVFFSARGHEKIEGHALSAEEKRLI